MIDRQTLFYKDANPVGDVVIIDDRVAEIEAPRFEIHISLPK